MAESAEWRDYEEEIFAQLKEWAGDQAEVEFDVKITGHSGVERQVDVLVTGAFAGEIQDGVTAAVDCKCYKKNVDIKAVDEFSGFVDDVQTDLGLLITTKGFSPGAKSRAKRGIKLRVIPRTQAPVVVAALATALPRPYFPAYDEGYYEGEFFDHAPYGPVGALVRWAWIEESPYTTIPGEEEWQDEVLVSGPDDEVSWGDKPSQRAIAHTVLRHRLGAEPDEEYVEMFIEEIATDWEDGKPWVLFDGELRFHLGV